MNQTTTRFRSKATIVLLGAAMAWPALAADNTSEVQALRQLVEALQKKVEAMESASAARTATPAQAAVAAPAAPAVTNTPGGFKFYGSLDSGVETVNNVGANKSSVTRVPTTTGSGPSALGIDVAKDVGSGYRAIGKAEMGIQLDNGASGQASRLFGRQAYVGMETPIGSITVGRQYNMLFWGLMAGDLLGPNIYGLGSIDPYIPNARTDNSVAWRGKFGPTSLGAAYSFGRDTLSTVPQSGSCAGEDASNSSACRSWSLLARFDAKSFGLAAALDQQSGGTGGTAGFMNGVAPVAFASSSDTDTRTTLNGFYKIDAIKLGAGWMGREVKTSATTIKQDTTWVQVDYAASPQWVYTGGVFHVANDTQKRSANLFALKAVYNFDAQLSTYLTLGHVLNTNGAYSVSGGGAGTGLTVAGSDQTGFMVGMRYRY